MVLMGIAGFESREPSDGDPIVCTCGATIGTRRLARSESQLAIIMQEHAAEHKERMAHQTRHRSLSHICFEDCP